jgi:putative transposase
VPPTGLLSLPRIARIAWTGCPYHLTHRGNRGGAVFLQDSDRQVYLGMLSARAAQEGLRVWAYCLMPNHVHLIVVGERETSMARCIGNTHRRHAQRVNLREGWTGHLWANRFFSTPMDDRYLWAAARYVELNPVRAGLARRPTDYPWSSARAHAHGVPDELLASDRPFPGAVEDWEEWLLAGLDSDDVDAIRLHTSTGRPTGSEAFVRGLEARIGSRLAARKRGPGTSRLQEASGRRLLSDR